MVSLFLVIAYCTCRLFRFQLMCKNVQFVWLSYIFSRTSIKMVQQTCLLINRLESCSFINTSKGTLTCLTQARDKRCQIPVSNTFWNFIIWFDILIANIKCPKITLKLRNSNALNNGVYLFSFDVPTLTWVI